MRGYSRLRSAIVISSLSIVRWLFESRPGLGGKSQDSDQAKRPPPPETTPLNYTHLLKIFRHERRPSAGMFSMTGGFGHQPAAGREFSQRRQRRRRVQHRRQRRRVVLDGAMEGGGGVENLLAGNVFGGRQRRWTVQEPIRFDCA